ncbi:MAG: hypothetical protein ACTSQE_16075 [Candidatus Heimdallarchaeaceae archaeon]
MDTDNRIFPFQRLVLRVKLESPLTFNPSSFTSDTSLYWSDFLNFDLTDYSIIASHFVPVRNNFSFYQSKANDLTFFDLNLCYNDTSIQQQIVENILLKNDVCYFDTRSIIIDGIFYHKVPSIMSSPDEVSVSFDFRNPCIISPENNDSFPSLQLIIEALRERLNSFSQTRAFINYVDGLDFASLNYSLSKYNIRSISTPFGISCIGNVAFHFSSPPPELLFLFYIIHIFGLGYEYRKGFGFVNIDFKIEDGE